MFLPRLSFKSALLLDMRGITPNGPLRQDFTDIGLDCLPCKRLYAFIDKHGLMVAAIFA